MQKITEYLEQNQARFIEELCAYVRFPSVSAQPKHKPDVQACAEWLLKHCRSLGLEARLCPHQGPSHHHRQNTAPGGQAPFRRVWPLRCPAAGTV